jgi:hypothetical protein
VISQGRIDEDPDNGREIQQGDKDWHPILTWTGVVTGWAAVKHKQGIGRNLENRNCTRAHGDCARVPVIQRGTVMRQQVQGEEVFPDEAQSRDYVWRLYNRKSLMLLMKTTGEDLSNTYKDGKRAVAEAPNWGGANACDKRQPPMMKGKDTKESWCRWSCQAERHRSSKHRNRGGGLRGVYRKFLFLCN